TGHAEGAAVAAQLGPAAAVANSASTGLPALGPSRIPAPTGMSLTRACTEADIDRIVADHVRAARGAREAGFDAIEIHFGHNYLVIAFLSPRLNTRQASDGASLENLARS